MRMSRRLMKVIDVTSEQVYAAGRKAALTDGVFLGQSSGGSNLCGGRCGAQS